MTEATDDTTARCHDCGRKVVPGEDICPTCGTTYPAEHVKEVRPYMAGGEPLEDEERSLDAAIGSWLIFGLLLVVAATVYLLVIR